MRSNSHYDMYEPAQERANWFKGCLFMVLFFAGAMGIVQLMVYFFSK